MNICQKFGLIRDLSTTANTRGNLHRSGWMFHVVFLSDFDVRARCTRKILRNKQKQREKKKQRHVIAAIGKKTAHVYVIFSFEWGEHDKKKSVHLCTCRLRSSNAVCVTCG